MPVLEKEIYCRVVFSAEIKFYDWQRIKYLVMTDSVCCVQMRVTQEDTQQTGSVTLLNNATPLMTLYVTAVLTIELPLWLNLSLFVSATPDAIC